MRVALFNPPWSFEGSIYFGCRDPHLPLEYGYAKALLERAGHEVLLADAHLGVAWERSARSLGDPRKALADFGPDFTVITTAPSYLFWRCAPPELRVPMQSLARLREVAGRTVIVGPHASTTPGATLKKLGADAAVLGECEEVLVDLANTTPSEWSALPHVATPDSTGTPKPRAADLEALPPLDWPGAVLTRHAHHHHRFDRKPEGPGGELEASRGCPYHCTFCAKDNFRDAFRKRPLEAILTELDAMLERGVRYVYFVDEIFVPDAKLLDALSQRDVAFGVQMRIDNWSPAMLDRLAGAGCVSVEAGVESITERGRSLLAKRCKLSTDQLTSLLVYAKERIAFVQANLLDATDPKDQIAAWRAYLHDRGVWANDPVPLFPYPGSPEYTLRFGAADDYAWERAHEHYLQEFAAFSDIQEARPLPLAELEGAHA
jgi:B12-binding domain/radical SAM domain protein of rhizo-twelve system